MFSHVTASAVDWSVLSHFGPLQGELFLPITVQIRNLPYKPSQINRMLCADSRL